MFLGKTHRRFRPLLHALIMGDKRTTRQNLGQWSFPIASLFFTWRWKTCLRRIPHSRPLLWAWVDQWSAVAVQNYTKHCFQFCLLCCVECLQLRSCYIISQEMEIHGPWPLCPLSLMIQKWNVHPHTFPRTSVLDVLISVHTFKLLGPG